ncbi:aspartyl-phosphate phosphatase Spo0E family protein [Ammoniphilus oxalaticus]|uniref:aspartyl-phosphate phosphatase Spo0E family protein n=1 Tax=Ammoniphilus oxalaticus TaxID=66863 RepID=UPI000E74AE6E|nr:aspartyl-phosphate phosphatase Spo0E family protein [Ammoniphilus oxalaticus]
MIDVKLEKEIEKLKGELRKLAIIHKYNFQHPEVVALSQQLDKLITYVMRKGNESY